MTEQSPAFLELTSWEVFCTALGTQCTVWSTATAAKSLQSCPTLCDPIDGSPPGSPSLGFSRQEHWSGLPFPSPMHESESEIAQSCPTLATPWTAAHQAPPSQRFSRQEHWSGLPFPSPMQESEKWKWSRSVVSDSSDPMDCSLPGSSVHGIF